MAGENTRWVHRWFAEVWNQADGNAVDSAIDAMMADDAVMHGLGEAGRDTNGTVPFKQFNARFRSAFSNIDIRIDATVEEGDMIAARWTGTMMHSGDGLGLPATNRPVTVTGMSMARLRNGRMVEGWNNWDTMELMQQIAPQRAPVELVED
jgi:predicted ester cyclase